MSMKSILIALEESAGTDRATDLAIDLAQTHGAVLVGLAIIDVPDITAGAAMGIGAASFKHERDQALILDAHQRAREFEQRFSERCKKAPVTGRVLQVTGRPAEAILAELENHDLVMLGRDANFRFETEASDTRTWDVVLHRASRPVIVVPENDLPRGRAALIAYDGSLAATRVLKTFAASGLAQGRGIHVVTVNDSGAVAWELATQAVETLKGLGLEAEVHNVVSVLPIADALLEVAAQVDAGLIAMGAFAHSRLRKLFRGSVTQQLVEKTTYPLFLTH
jgi:nucleotide-binding universal stress UspA family protein